MYFLGDKARHSKTDLEAISDYENYFRNSPLPLANKLQSFPKYVRRQDIARFLAKHEIFKKQLNVPGIIVECGVFVGGG